MEFACCMGKGYLLFTNVVSQNDFIIIAKVCTNTSTYFIAFAAFIHILNKNDISHLLRYLSIVLVVNL